MYTHSSNSDRHLNDRKTFSYVTNVISVVSVLRALHITVRPMVEFVSGDHNTSCIMSVMSDVVDVGIVGGLYFIVLPLLIFAEVIKAPLLLLIVLRLLLVLCLS